MAKSEAMYETPTVPAFAGGSFTSIAVRGVGGRSSVNNIGLGIGYPTGLNPTGLITVSSLDGFHPFGGALGFAPVVGGLGGGLGGGTTTLGGHLGGGRGCGRRAEPLATSGPPPMALPGVGIGEMADACAGAGAELGDLAVAVAFAMFCCEAIDPRGEHRASDVETSGRRAHKCEGRRVLQASVHIIHISMRCMKVPFLELKTFCLEKLILCLVTLVILDLSTLG
jgi:hypothetical protein